MSAAEKFLHDFQSRPLPPLVTGLKPKKLILGKGHQPLEVAVLTSNNEPKVSTLKDVQKKRKNHRASPVLLTVIHGDNQASLCGPSGESPPVHKNIELKLVEKFCRTALKQPDRHKVLKLCSHFLPSVEKGLFGIHNKGMLASHHLVHGVKKRGDWEEATEKSKNISHFEKTELLEKLGFQISQLDSLTYILRSKNKKRALAVLLEPSETHESKEQRFNQLSPVSYAMNKAEQENMPWVLMVQDNHIRLYSAKKESGLNHSTRTETYVECQPSLLQEENLAYLWLLFSAEALREGGSLTEILENSKRFSVDMAENLKSRIYDEIVPQIAKGIFNARNLKKPTAEELNETYQMTLTVLFRLLFIAYAEDRDLLPYKLNEVYQNRSLKKKAQELSELLAKGKNPDRGDNNHWKETARLWEAIDKGKEEWGVMAYNGGLFSAKKDISKTGSMISKISVSNEFFVPALKSLLLIETEERLLAPVDFRFMGPREFGTIYEGLLESSLAIADEDLALDKKDIYVPVKKLQSGRKKQVPVAVRKNDVYLHNQSGARKATGSYYTKSFAVEYLLDKSLEPALKEHFKRLDKLHDKEAEKEFFNFFTADIAMGSGHFLVAAVDRIEKSMANYLDKRPLSGVQNTLNKIKDTAEKNLKGISDDYFPVENTKYLARHIARHCIYGVDNNELAVQLAKLSLWTHTFIPGLPLSYFNHNLRCGNSLVGIGTIEEICSELRDKEDKRNLSFKFIDTENLIGQAKKPLNNMKKLTDLNLEEVKQGRKAQKEIVASLKDTEALFDVTIFNRIKNKGDIHKMEGWILKWIHNKKSIHNSKMLKDARSELKGLKTLHFPITFPEVFLRERPGFDVILGNPPWEKVKLEEHAFWARYFPGLRGLSQREREIAMAKSKKNYPNLVKKYQSELSKTNQLKNILKKSSYTQSGSGDSDLYKFFSWRFWHLICEKNGFLGVVLPGNVFSAKGTEFYRKELFKKAFSDITMLINNRKWVFSEVHAQYIIGLNTIQKGGLKKKNIQLSGPFNSFNDFKKNKKLSFSFTKEQILSWTDSASLPSLPKEDSLDVFFQLRKSPRLDLNDKNSWRVRPDTELHTTGSKPLMDLKSKKCPKGFWPVFTGRSFDIWMSDTGIYYAYANPKKVNSWLYKKRLNGYKSQKSVHSEFSSGYVRNDNTLPCFKPRIAFQDVTNSIDYRTVKAALLPPEIFCVHKAPYLLFSRGDEQDEAFLLGVLSSIPLDWYARRFVSTNSLGFFLLNTFPIPRPSRKNPLWKRVVALSGRLASPDERFSKWAKAVGVEYGELNEQEQNNMIYELDAIVAHLYGLSEKQLIHIFETFHRTWNYNFRLKSVLKYYNFWKKKKKP